MSDKIAQTFGESKQKQNPKWVTHSSIHMTIYSVALAEYLPERDSPTLKTSITPPVFFFCFVNEGEYSWQTCLCVNSALLFVILICWQPPEATTLRFKLFSSNMDM